MWMCVRACVLQLMSARKRVCVCVCVEGCDVRGNL